MSDSSWFPGRDVSRRSKYERTAWKADRRASCRITRRVARHGRLRGFRAVSAPDRTARGWSRGVDHLLAAIGHAPWLFAEADVAKGRRLTSYASLRTDLENAGAEWVDEEVVVDNGLVTSRNPGDLDAFIAKMLEEIEEGVHTSPLSRS